MNLQAENTLNLIETLRNEMVSLAMANGMNDLTVLHLSQRLDIEINKHYQMVFRQHGLS